ncbi:uncharacterized protein L203_100287 [Cryptococcus depauperatus CBS 7841]|uniref:HMA domain-containing protein n=1 Tax=Cryptococcus depauperatus CBS 7841 TaxID=1295531 RepID=A0AAJ8JMX0_9TREE
MHCTSCCDAISSLLATLPAVRNVSTSLLLQTITFSIDNLLATSSSKHTPTVTSVVDQVVLKLGSEGGFVVASDNGARKDVQVDTGDSWKSRLGSRWGRNKDKRRIEERRRKHVEWCKACQNEEQKADSTKPQQSRVALAGSFGAPLLTAQGDVLETTFSIRDMTSAVAPSTISARLDKHPDIEKVTVDLTHSSVQVWHKAKLRGEEVKKIIEDLGYDAEMIESKITQSEAVSENQIQKGALHGDQPQEYILKTNFSIEGMTCASCSSSIASSLEKHPDIAQVDINLLQSMGKIRHKAKVSVEEIEDMIQDLGYEAKVIDCEPEAELSSLTVKAASATPLAKTTLAITGMTCVSCTSAITQNLLNHPKVKSVEINLLGSSGVVIHDQHLKTEEVKEIINDSGFETEVINTMSLAASDDKPEKLKSIFSIEGMVCTSCSSAIKSALKGHKGIEDMEIDLLNNQGIIIHTHEITANEIENLIESAGYDVKLFSSECLSHKSSKGKKKDESLRRTVRIQTDGLFCGDCVIKVNSYLSQLPLLSYTPITLRDPVTSITYRPHEPLTVREVIQGLSGLDPAFEVNIQKPQSLSERSKEIQKREVRLLASHLLVAVVFSIPVFIIAIVAMILVADNNRFKMKMMEPQWGAANLGTLILWPLATVVQFGVGRIFYRRTFASLLPHLRGIFPTFFVFKSQRKLPKRPMSWKSFFNYGSMDLLVALSTSVSYFASLAMLIIDIRNPRSASSIGTYFDSCVFLIMFILLGRTLEAYAKSRTTDAVNLLGGLRSDTALLVEPHNERVHSNDEDDSIHKMEKHLYSPASRYDTLVNDTLHKQVSQLIDDTSSTQTQHTTQQIPISHLELGDFLLLPPGSLPPADAVIFSGTTTFDESSLTGESHPVHKAIGDEIYTGTTNLTSAVIIRVTRLDSDTMIEKIIHAVSDATSRKAPLEKLAEKLTDVFVPIIVYFSLIVLAVWLPLALTGTVQPHTPQGGRVFFALEFAIATLVVACPCGIGLAVPCANAVGNGIAAKVGILASGGGEAFLGATKVKRVVFDKTGTLTVGRSEVMDEFWEDWSKIDKPRIVQGIVELEKASTHPLAVGIVKYFEKNNYIKETAEVKETNEIAGRGLKAKVKVGSSIFEFLVGNVTLLIDHSVEISMKTLSTISRLTNEGKSVVLVAVATSESKDYTFSSLFSLSDPPRPESASVIATLRSKGIAVNMISGDNETTAQAVGKMIGLTKDEIKGDVGPEGKAEVIRVHQEKKGRGGEKEVVMFIGDGLNDAVALAAADISVAMGHGSQATLASSDFVFLSSSLASLYPLLNISRKVVNRQKLNLGWAIVFNVICIPFAAGVFYGAGGIRLTPVWSAVLMAASSVSVVCSSLAMRWGL